MLNVRTSDQPPDAGPELEVRRVGAAAVNQYIFLCVKPRGFWTHWNEAKRRTQPCLEPVETCPGHKQQLPLRWKAYAHVFDLGQHDQCLIELTPGASRQLFRALGDHENLRGMRVQISRGKGPKARLFCSVQKLPSEAERRNLPAEHNALTTLSKVWGFDEKTPPRFPESDLI